VDRAGSAAIDNEGPLWVMRRPCMWWSWSYDKKFQTFSIKLSTTTIFITIYTIETSENSGVRINPVC
jgi:hypothetical protein